MASLDWKGLNHQIFNRLLLVIKHSKLFSMDILISGPCLGAKDRFMFCNRTKYRAVTDLLTGQNTLRRHLHLLGLLDSPLCTRCGAEEETSLHILCECEALASLRHAYLGSFFLEPDDIKSISLAAIWNFIKATGLPHIDVRHNGPLNKA
jgi:hypothetical protein